jgi:hypothetical protein
MLYTRIVVANTREGAERWMEQRESGEYLPAGVSCGSGWMYVNASGENLHVLGGLNVHEFAVHYTSGVLPEVRREIDYSIYATQKRVQTPPPIMISIPKKEIEVWASRLRVIDSVLRDLEYVNMSAEVAVVAAQMKKKIKP